jgi:release factor glutamine methyltransferase
MDRRVIDFEPSQALFVPEQNPLTFYQRIANLASDYLVPGGQVFLEIYHLAGPAVKSLFQGPQWSQALIKKDLQGKDRIVKAILKQSR